MRRVGWLVTAGWVTGCACGESGCSGGNGSDPTDTASTGAPSCAAEVVDQTLLVCADPGARAASRFDHKQAATRRLPATNQTSGGLAVGDVNGDGLLDLMVAHELESQLWFNLGDGTWAEQVGAFAGIDLSAAVGMVLADYDGDDDLDLTVTRWGAPNRLLANDGAGGFTDVTAAAGWSTTAAWRTQSASWADVDLDGDLDVYFGAYGPKPDSYTTAFDPADPSEFYLNDGDGTFTDRSDWIPAELHDGYAFSSAFYDLDGDLYPELIQFHDFGTTSAGRNSRAAKNLAGQGFSATYGNGIDRGFEDMGVGVADLNGDGLPDFALTSWKKVSVLSSSTSGWFESANNLGIEVEVPNRNQVYGWGADFGDVDNDGDVDLAMAFGYWSVYDGAGDPLVQVDGLWIQDANGAFENLAFEPEWAVNDKGIGRGVLFADVNDDGFLDLLKRELGDDSPTLQHLSRCDDNSFLRVELRDDGLNTRAIGAIVDVDADGRRHRRWIHAGSASLYVGHPPEAHVGLADATTADVTVTWPDGCVTEHPGIDTRQRIQIHRTR